MRQRTTFFHHNEDGIEPTSLKVAGPSISAPDVLAVREDRITLGLDELPSEIHELLRNTHELHIRWWHGYRRRARSLVLCARALQSCRRRRGRGSLPAHCGRSDSLQSCRPPAVPEQLSDAPQISHPPQAARPSSNADRQWHPCLQSR